MAEGQSILFNCTIQAKQIGSVSASLQKQSSIDYVAETEQDVSYIEGLIPEEFGADAVEILGARELLATLEAANAPWAIVTSGTRPLVHGWLKVLKLTNPKNLVVAEDVNAGKPDPACYLLAKDRLHLDPDAVALVIEDAPAGIRAGKSAGCKVIGLATTHHVRQLQEAGADWILKDLRSLKLVSRDPKSGYVSIEISNPME